MLFRKRYFLLNSRHSKLQNCRHVSKKNHAPRSNNDIRIRKVCRRRSQQYFTSALTGSQFRQGCRAPEIITSPFFLTCILIFDSDPRFAHSEKTHTHTYTKWLDNERGWSVVTPFSRHILHAAFLSCFSNVVTQRLLYTALLTICN